MLQYMHVNIYKYKCMFRLNYAVLSTSFRQLHLWIGLISVAMSAILVLSELYREHYYH